MTEDRWFKLLNIEPQNNEPQNDEVITSILKIPAACCRESSKCKERIPFHYSPLANPRS
jgi:hypothetical protein